MEQIDKKAYRLLKFMYRRKYITERQFVRIIGREYANSYLFAFRESAYFEVASINGHRVFRLSQAGRAAYEKSCSEKRRKVLKTIGDMIRTASSVFRH